MSRFFRFWQTGEDKPTIADENKIREMYTRKRHSVLLSVMFYVYAVGKFTNGFLSDRANIKRFMSTGLLVSALVNLIIGLNQFFIFFVILWGINGWFQSMGSPPSVVSLTQWYSRKEYGSYYGIWAASHSIGQGLTFVATSFIVSTFGWLMGTMTMFGLTGAITSGFVSDRLFGSKRNIPTLIYGSLLIVGLGLFEFALGGSLVFLAGLVAVDVVSTKATGAVKGVIGLFSYVGAATQEYVSGLLINAGKEVVGGTPVYNFDNAFYSWIGAATLSQAFSLSFWNVKSKA